MQLTNEERNKVSAEYRRLQRLPEHADTYNHNLMEIALGGAPMMQTSFSMSDAADEYERYERSEEIIRGL